MGELRVLRRMSLAVGVAMIAALALAMTASAAPTLTTWGGLPSNATPRDTALGGDGNVWYTDPVNRGVGRITTGGSVSEFGGASWQPQGIGAGSNGNMWFTEDESGLSMIGRISSSGVVSQYSYGLSAGSEPLAIVKGPDGNMWFTESGQGGAIGRITPGGTISEFWVGLPFGSSPQDIAAGPDGNLWFTDAVGAIGRITPQGTITEFSSGISSGSTPESIIAGPDGNMWFTANGSAPRVARITPQGTITEFASGISSGATLRGIASGRDGNIYFSEAGIPAIGKITPAGAVTQYGITAGSGPRGLTSGADGNIWVALGSAGALARMTVGAGVGAVTPTSVTSTGGTVAAPISPNSQATTYAFEYGPTTAYGSTTNSTSSGSGVGPATRSASLTGLAPSTTYHVRATATNGTATTYGPDRTFTTTAAGAPSATTGDAGPTASSATLNGTVNTQSVAGSYHFEWGPTAAYGSSVPQADASLPASAADQPVAQAISGLEPNTTYHFRVVATSTSGTTYGDDESFSTDAVPAAATTDAATGVGTGAATLAGTINPRNSGAGWHFDWGKSANFGTSTPDTDVWLEADNSDHAVTQAITGLEPNKTYHYQLVANGLGGPSTGAQRVFKTLAVAPDATTGDADAVTTSGALLKATVNAHNSNAQYRFEWGDSDAYGNSTDAADAGDDNDDHEVSSQVDGLAPATTYHYRVVASSDAGETPGADHTFTTAAVPPPVADPGPQAHDPAPTPDPAPAPVPAPVLGKAVSAAPVSGTVRFRAPGADGYTTLDDAARIPVGALIDTRAGRITLTSALDKEGATQNATFWNGLFTVRQARKSRGVVDVYVARPAGCHAAKARKSGAVSAARNKRRRNSLWGHDHHGRFRSHGRGSIATVRGTTWLTEVRCDGTRTRVKDGKVAVRDLRKRSTKVLRAGQSYFARAR